MSLYVGSFIRTYWNAGTIIETELMQVSTLEYESSIAAPYKALQKEHPNVALGSYVNLTEEKTGTRDTSFNTRLTVEGRSAEEVKEIGNKLIELFKGKIVDPSTAV